jgi:PKD repeat protein
VNPTVIYNTPGTYSVKLYVVGGGCDMLDSMVTSVTVKANPTVSVTATPSTICQSQSSVITASGGTSYQWSPATNLSATTGASVTANPTSTTSYNVTVTGANGCSAISAVTINVDQPPVPTVTVGNTSICIGNTITWDASASSNVTTFNWTFPGGTPATSTNAVQTVTYNSAGNYTTALTISNSCASDNTYTHAVSVGCVGIDEPDANDNFQSYFNQWTNSVMLNATQLQTGEELSVNIISSLGQLIYSGKVAVVGGTVNAAINVGNIAPGIYYLQAMNSSVKYRMDFFKN